MTTTHWMANELSKLAELRGGLNLNAARYNPRPAGVIRDGSASHVILAYLATRPARFVSCAELITGTGRTHAAVSWALVYLRSIGSIEAVSDASRNPRYNRYRLAKGSSK